MVDLENETVPWEYDHIVDDRGRVTLPRKIRQQLTADEIVVSKGFDECMFGFDKEQWEREAEKYVTTTLTDPTGRELRRYLFAAAEIVEVDRLGRILLPAQLKEYAKISKEVVIVGAGDHFELWNLTMWQTHPRSLAADAS